jgi:hypothetical protein
MKRGMNVWPPFLFSGIRIRSIREDWREVVVELRQSILNRNYVGVHFGGSIFAMTDPFWMMMVMNSLDRGYTVWDRAARIEFLRPGKGVLTARFELKDADLEAIRDALTEDGTKLLKEFSVDIFDQSGATVATVWKTLHIRRKADTRARIGG